MEPIILFEDDQLLVVDKPTGMIVYPDGKHDYPALSAWLEKKLGEGNFHFVHRIDRETSGVLCVAKTAEAFEFIKEQFKNRETKKTYRAFVHGTFKEERGIIDKPIGSSRGGSGPRSAKLSYGVQRDATTMYKVLKSQAYEADTQEPVSYVEVFPKTGRTHQIRVHFASIGRPILGDRLYGTGRPNLLGFERLALHALSLSLTHPNGEEMTFKAPLPPDFVAAEGQLRSA
ncbi:MAG TPA: RluA family pseudouridine synthase [Candidatus Paceibacterota bacterium]|jgi:RluA family pseudouridine synthase|nr:RluA family pseudouridine synthase [Candidatus Paceibacterota bacterium]